MVVSKKEKKPVLPIKAQIENALDVEGGWCRAANHNWKATPPFTVEKGVVAVHYVCDNCHGSRHDGVSLRTGEVVHRSYHMTPGYVLKIGKDQARPSKSDWRKAHFTRIVRGR